MGLTKQGPTDIAWAFIGAHPDDDLGAAREARREASVMSWTEDA